MLLVMLQITPRFPVTCCAADWRRHACGSQHMFPQPLLPAAAGCALPCRGGVPGAGGGAPALLPVSTRQCLVTGMPGDRHNLQRLACLHVRAICCLLAHVPIPLVHAHPSAKGPAFKHLGASPTKGQECHRRAVGPALELTAVALILPALQTRGEQQGSGAVQVCPSILACRFRTTPLLARLPNTELWRASSNAQD